MDSTIIRCKQIVVETLYQINNLGQYTWSLYLYSMKSPVTKWQYQKRLEKFFDFLDTKER